VSFLEVGSASVGDIGVTREERAMRPLRGHISGFNRIAAVLAVAGLMLTMAAPGFAAAPQRPPNIVYIMLDEWGYYESSGMGHPILKTPNIDRLAAEGLRFTRMHAGGNVCAPTRCTLMTGKHLGHATVRTNPGGVPIRAEDVTIAEVLHKAGYATGGFGKWGLGDRGTTGVPEKHGFDVFFGYYHQVHAHSFFPNYLLRNSEKVPLEGNTGDFHKGQTFSQDLIFAESLKFIRDHKDAPFFAFLPWTPPHGQWGMPENDPSWLQFKDAPFDIANPAALRNARMYAAMIAMDDRQVGAVLALLKELQIEDNTIVFLSGDNGAFPYFEDDKHPGGFFAGNRDPRTGTRLRGGKGNFYEGGISIPFIVRWPGHITPGSTSDYVGYLPDVFPTLAELTGLTVPGGLDGVSLTPTLLGESASGRTQKPHEAFYWEDPRSRAVRMGDWKAIQPGPKAPFELYNLAEDPEEKHDQAAKYPEILARLKSRAETEHTPVVPGGVLDPAAGFQNHAAR
jgi:arylsulfatase A-like enzyme